MNEEKLYTVFVGGAEVCFYYHILGDAQIIAGNYIAKGYEDVAIVSKLSIDNKKEVK